MVCSQLINQFAGQGFNQATQAGKILSIGVAISGALNIFIDRLIKFDARSVSGFFGPVRFGSAYADPKLTDVYIFYFQSRKVNFKLALKLFFRF